MAAEVEKEIARLDERDWHILRRLDQVDDRLLRMDGKLDTAIENHSKLRSKVAAVSASISLAVSVVVTMASTDVAVADLLGLLFP